MSVAQAAPLAAPGESLARQPDGTTFAIRQHGNGSVIWYSHDDYTIVRNDAGQWVYAQAVAVAKHVGGPATVIGASPFVVGRADPAAAGLQPNLTPVISVSAAAAAKSVTASNPMVAATGSIPLLVILGYYDDAVNAPNCSACAKTSPDYFQEAVFSKVPEAKSVVNYFSQASLGTLAVIPVAESHGEANDGIVGWLNLGATTPEGTTLSTSAYKSNTLAADAINAAMAYVDFTAYDTNGDAVVSARELSILVIIAGYEGSYGRDENSKTLSEDTTSPRVWGQSRSFVPAFSGVEAPVQSRNGKTVTINTTESGGMTYSVMAELHGDHPATIGIMAHELGHAMLGLPDLYDITNASSGIGVWSLMSYGSWGQSFADTYAGATPVMLDAWSRYAMGWITPVTPSSGSQFTADASHGSDADVILLPTDKDLEYFLIENRQNGGFDRGLERLLVSVTFGGLAVWHIDDSVGTPGFNNDNANKSHRRVDLIAAVNDSLLDDGSGYGQAVNLYYAGNVTDLNGSTTPDTDLYDGTPSGFTLSQVSASAAAMTGVVTYSGTATTVSVTGEGDGSTQESASSGGGGGGTLGVWAVVLGGLFRRYRR